MDWYSDMCIQIIMIIISPSRVEIASVVSCSYTILLCAIERAGKWYVSSCGVLMTKLLTGATAPSPCLCMLMFFEGTHDV